MDVVLNLQINLFHLESPKWLRNYLETMSEIFNQENVECSNIKSLKLIMKQEVLI